MSAGVELDPAGFNALRMCRWGPMLYNRHDVYVGRSLERYGEYSWLESELFAQLLKPGAVVIEAGANIGAHTVSLSRLVGAGGAVLAFEPLRLVFQNLCANLALNQCANVWAFQQALGAANAMTPVPSLDPTQPNNFGGITLRGAQGNDIVPQRTVDSLELGVCHLLKADVEGMEIELLQGARNTIARCRPALYVENDRAERSAALIELIMQLGYDLYWHLPPLFNPNNFAGEAENIFPNIVSTNMICFPSEATSNVQGFRRITSPADRWNA
jgi:FkbM family methyltransferase